METFLSWLVANADHAHYLIFFLLVLTGLSIPISEDVMLVASGVLAATVVPEKTWHLFAAVFLGTYISDNIAYGLGRFCSKKLSAMRWFKRIFDTNRLGVLNNFFARHGAWTLFIGRFIPFGIRNGIFMTAGISKMPLGRFMVSDGISCLLFTALIFFTAYLVGQNYESLLTSLHWIGIGTVLVLGVLVTMIVVARKHVYST